jgi:hypothetical protein
VVVVNVLSVELLPTLLPFTFHWYNGVVPPNVGVAVNVTEVPLQMVAPTFDAILTDGAAIDDTFNVTALLVTEGEHPLTIHWY